MTHPLHPLLQMVIGLLSLGVLISPIILASKVDLDKTDQDQTHIP
jgi:hypothetical protein